MNLITIFDEKVARRPTAPALLGFEKKRILTISYALLGERVNAMAVLLSECGIKAGDKVALFTPSGHELFGFLLAIFKLGAVCVFIDPGFSLKQIYRCLSDARADYILACPLVYFGLNLFPPAHCQIFNAATLVKRAAEKKIFQGHIPDTADLPDEAAALMTFTSGSSGKPKCLVRSHGFLTMQSRVLAESLARAGRDLELTTLPIFVLNNLALGVPSFLASPKSSPALTIEALKQCKVSNILSAPAFLQGVSRELARRGESLAFVEEITVGGGPVFPFVLTQARQVFPNANIKVVYGSSEVEPISFLEVSDLEHYAAEARAGNGLLVGRAVAYTEILIAKAQVLDAALTTGNAGDWSEAIVADGGVGEILVAARHCLVHYSDSRQVIASNKVRLNGRIYHRTGDAGYLDKDGFLHYLGPVKGQLSQSCSRPCFSTQIEAAFLASFAEAVRVACDPQTLILYVQLAEDQALPRTLEYWSLPAIFPHAFKIKVLQQLPVDRRHGSKILYEKLPKETRLVTLASSKSGLQKELVASMPTQ